MHTSTLASPGMQAVLPLENNSLGRLIVLLLHERLVGDRSGSGAAQSLRALGWHDSLLSEMHALPADELARVLGGPNGCVAVVVDQQKVAAGLQSYHAIKRDQRDLEFFLLGGATPALIRQLFPKVSSRTVTALRRRLGCESRGGRPPLPDTETSHSIYRCWQALCAQEPSPRLRYMRLKKHFPELSLATLCAAVEDR
jgi:hypothetical protein